MRIRPGADAQGSQEWAVAMKQVSNRLVSFCAAIMVIAGSNAGLADTYNVPQLLPVLDQSSDDKGSFCLDSMETVPFSDELEPTLVSLDGGCSMSEGTIAT